MAGLSERREQFPHFCDLRKMIRSPKEHSSDGSQDYNVALYILFLG